MLICVIESIIFLLIPLFYLNIASGVNLIERLVFSLVYFWGMNSFYLFITSYIFEFPLSLVGIIITNLLYISLVYFLSVKKYNPKLTKTKFSFKHRNKAFFLNFPWGEIILIFLTTFVFFSAWFKFSDKLRLPITSPLQDAANHFKWSQLIFLKNNLMEGSLYPQSFHANEALIMKSLANIFTSVSSDVVVRVNIFSLFVFLNVAFLMLISYFVVNKILSFKINLTHFSQKNLVLIKIFSAVITFLFSSIFVLPQLHGGFLSTLFAQIFLLSFIYVIFTDKEYKEIYFLPLISGFLFSYIYAGPLLILFLLLYIFNQPLQDNKKNLLLFITLFVISLLFFTAFLYRLVQFRGIKTASLLVSTGSPTPIPNMIIIALFSIWIIFSFFYQKKYNPELVKKFNLANSILIATLGYLILLSSIEIIRYGIPTYPFYKINYMFISVISPIAAAGIIYFVIISLLWLKNKIKKDLNTNFLIIFLTLLVMVMLNLMTRNHFTYLEQLTRGQLNFMTNNAYKYNSIVYVLENLKHYNYYIYLDPDFQSSQWGANGLLYPLVKVINLNRSNGFNAGVKGNVYLYENVVRQKLAQRSTVLVIDPTKQLENSCASQYLVKEATKSSLLNIYPNFSFTNYKNHCQ